MEYLSVAELSNKWGISKRRIQILIKEGRIPGTLHKGNMYLIPENAKKPEDKRYKKVDPEDEYQAYRESIKELWKNDPKVIFKP